ncbi:unnamed protein product, partial [Phaeothamnion confervicola]
SAGSLAVQEKIDQGTASLALGTSAGILQARDQFAVAVSLATSTTGATTAQLDTARYFWALTRAAALASDLAPSNSLESLGGFLSGFGYDAAARTSLSTLQRPATFPSTSPTGSDVRTFLQGRARQELTGALATLSQVSDDFRVSWTD